MLISYEFIPNTKLSDNKVIEIKEKIEKSVLFLENTFGRCLSYLYKEKELDNYIEIDLPLFESDITIKINLFYEKILVSVMNHKDSEFFGYLIIEGFDCLDNESIKEIGKNISPKFNFEDSQ